MVLQEPERAVAVVTEQTTHPTSDVAMIHAQRQPRSLADRAGAALPREKGLVVRRRYPIHTLESACARDPGIRRFDDAGRSSPPRARNDFVPVRQVIGAHVRTTLLLMCVIRGTRARQPLFPVFRVFRVALSSLLVRRSHWLAAPCSQRLVRLAAPGDRHPVARQHCAPACAGDAAWPSGRSERERDGRKTESDQVDRPTAARGRHKAHRRPAQAAPAADRCADPLLVSA
jgi:hypothetical protein